MNSNEIKDFTHDIIPNLAISGSIFYIITFNTSFYVDLESEYSIIDLKNTEKCYNYFYSTIILLLVMHLLFVFRGFIKFICSYLNIYNRVLTKALMNISDILLYT